MTLATYGNTIQIDNLAGFDTFNIKLVIDQASLQRTHVGLVLSLISSTLESKPTVSSMAYVVKLTFCSFLFLNSLQESYLCEVSVDLFSDAISVI